MVLNFFRRIGYFFKNLFFGLLQRMKPKATFRWIFSAFIWLIVLAYLGFGVYFAFQVYSKHSESKATKFAVNIYPYPVAVVNGGGNLGKIILSTTGIY